MLPNLIHPIPTDIQPFQPEETIQDDGYSEPVQATTYGDTYTIPGQWKWFSDYELRMQANGAQEASDGYVVLRLIDLEALGQSIKRGDRIAGYGTGRGRQELDVYVVRLRFEGHYPDQGGPSLVKAFFSDRQPGRQTRGV